MHGDSKRGTVVKLDFSDTNSLPLTQHLSQVYHFCFCFFLECFVQTGEVIEGALC